MKIRGAVIALLASIAILTTISACKTTGDYVWVDDLPPVQSTPDREYVIQVGDTISVRVWGQDSMSVRTKVRPDGRISVPFVNDVDAAGNTPSALSKVIQSRLKDLYVNPVVTVSLDEPRALSVSVLGEVTKPGAYVLEQGSGVLQAIAAAGGMTPFANKDAVMVIRQDSRGGSPQRIRFTYESLAQAKGRAASFRLRGGDVVIVE